MMDDRNELAFTVAREINDPLEQLLVVLYTASLAGALVMIDAEDRGVDRDEHLASLLDSLKEAMPEYGAPGEP